MNRSKIRREHQTIVVGMRHNQGTNQTSGDTPRRGPDILFLVFFIQIFHIESLGEILSKEMGRTSLQGLAILHQSLDTIGVKSTAEAFIGGFYALYDRNCHEILHKIRINMQHTLCLFDSFLAGGVGGMALLPQELGRAEEKTGAHFPTDHIGPLVAKDRQITV